jgi:hypothetical protein
MVAEKITERSLALALAAALLAAATPANAATVPVANGGNLFLSEQTTGSGSGPFGNISLPASPGNYTYSDSFATGPQSTFVGTTGSGFYDDFIFTIAAGQVESITSSITLGNMLGISGMQVRLYDYNANGMVAPLLTNPVAGSAFDTWSSTVAFPGGSTTMALLQPTTLTTGTYAIEVRGTVSGTSGGNFTGSLNLTPVPLPSGLPTLLCGLGLLAIVAFRGRSVSPGLALAGG